MCEPPGQGRSKEFWAGLPADRDQERVPCGIDGLSGPGSQCNAYEPLTDAGAHCVIAIGAAKHTPGDTFLFKGQFGGKPAKIMLDSGAKRSLADHTWLQKRTKGAPACMIHELAQPLQVMGAGSTLHTVTHECEGEVVIQGCNSPATLLVLQDLLQGIDVILGMDWLKANRVDLHCGSCTVSIVHAGKRRQLIPVEEKTPSVDACTAAAMRTAYERVVKDDVAKTDGPVGNRTKDLPRARDDVLSAK
ncbi:MAG: retroviral-like aspartic protease [Deltaproteobacteria bacterium]|nr:retroviral-like aspartic protease [Deltaproteobacteria bacterium]